MPDPQPQKVRVVPDPPESGEPEGAERGSGRALPLLGLVLAGSLAANGYQTVSGRGLQTELESVQATAAALELERDGLVRELDGTRQALERSRATVATVHTGLASVREQIANLETLTAPTGASEAEVSQADAARADEPGAPTHAQADEAADPADAQAPPTGEDALP